MISFGYHVVTAGGRRSGVTLLPSRWLAFHSLLALAVQSTVESRFGNQLLWSTSAELFSCQQAYSLYPNVHANVKISMLDGGCKRTSTFQIWHMDYTVWRLLVDRCFFFPAGLALPNYSCPGCFRSLVLLSFHTRGFLCCTLYSVSTSTLLLYMYGPGRSRVGGTRVGWRWQQWRRRRSRRFRDRCRREGRAAGWSSLGRSGSGMSLTLFSSVEQVSQFSNVYISAKLQMAKLHVSWLCPLRCTDVANAVRYLKLCQGGVENVQYATNLLWLVAYCTFSTPPSLPQKCFKLPVPKL